VLRYDDEFPRQGLTVMMSYNHRLTCDPGPGVEVPHDLHLMSMFNLKDNAGVGCILSQISHWHSHPDKTRSPTWTLESGNLLLGCGVACTRQFLG
jgi:hypothetical protein